MTSKRLGMVIAAALVLWSLTGSGWFAPTPSDWIDDVLLVGTAYAGDPDQYEEGVNPDAEPGEDPDGGSEPEPPSDEDQSGREDITQTIVSFVSLLLWGIGGTTL